MLTNSDSHLKYALHLFHMETALEEQRKNTIRTTLHLLSAASSLFAEKGFRDGTNENLSKSDHQHAILLAWRKILWQTKK